MAWSVQSEPDVEAIHFCSALLRDGSALTHLPADAVLQCLMLPPQLHILALC